jgi:hypothetical protein
MCGIGFVDLDAVAHGDRLHALARSIADQAEGIAGEVRSSLRRAEHVSDHFEVARESLSSGLIDLDVHGRELITRRSVRQLRPRGHTPTDRNDPTWEISPQERGRLTQ